MSPNMDFRLPAMVTSSTGKAIRPSSTTATRSASCAEKSRCAIAITVRKADERGHKLAVTVGYQRDGEAVLETVTVEAAAKKAKVVRSEGGDVALSLKLAPKRVPVEEARASRRKVEVEDTNDPLAGP